MLLPEDRLIIASRTAFSINGQSKQEIDPLRLNLDLDNKLGFEVRLKLTPPQAAPDLASWLGVCVLARCVAPAVDSAARAVASR